MLAERCNVSAVYVLIRCRFVEKGFHIFLFRIRLRGKGFKNTHIRAYIFTSRGKTSFGDIYSVECIWLNKVSDVIFGVLD